MPGLDYSLFLPFWLRSRPISPAVDGLDPDLLRKPLDIDAEAHGIGRVEKGNQMAEFLPGRRQLARLLVGVNLESIGLGVHGLDT